jgi:Ca2+-binding RTX toxin-like protein
MGKEQHPNRSKYTEGFPTKAHDKCVDDKPDRRPVQQEEDPMSIVPTTARSPRRSVTFAAAFALAAGIAVAAVQPAAAQPALVAVPPGCGSLSGTMVAANRIADFSASPVGVVFQAPAVANHITVGSQFNDTLTGNGVSETICGLGGGDTLKGGTGGVDDIFGGPGNDIIWGEAAGDTMLSGGPDVDAIYGDDPTNSHGGFDGADTIQGGDQNDTLRGGAGLDIIRGGLGTSDFADPQDGGAVCTAVENEAVPC